MAEMAGESAPASAASNSGARDTAGAESTPSKGGTAPKDKSCPYCGQGFTSSSLGRHLDLYIKERNPKPPDGIHLVDEIKRMRGSITRRQTRTSSARRQSLTPTTSKRSSQDGRMSPAVSLQQQQQQPPPPLPASAGPLRKKPPPALHTAGWEATGVILDLPQSSDGLPRLEPRRDSSRQTLAKTRIAQSQKEREALDTARASELALKELLGIVKAATALSQPAPSPFDFDPFTLTFPALVLRCLPLPPTLFSVQPFPTPSSCSLEIPGQLQYEALIQVVRNRYQRWRASPGTSPRKDSSSSFLNDMNGFTNGQEHGGNRNQNPGGQPRYQEEEQKVIRHIHDAFVHWKTLQEKHRQDTWRLEILRAYSSEQERRKSTERDLERAKQEAENLRAQVDQLSRCQHPREFLVHPIQTTPLPKETATELQNHLLGDPRDWEYDSLVSKWKTVIHTNRRNVSGMQAQQSLTPGGTPDGIVSHVTVTHSGFHTPMNTKAPLRPTPNNPNPNNNPNNNSTPQMNNDNSDMVNGFDAEADDDDEELEDAPADQAEDDPPHHPTHARHPSQAMMDRGVLDPTLQTNGGHGPMGGGMDGVEVPSGYERQIFRV